ncbi:MAG TPA: DNA primase [Bacilli bacterium]
MNYGNIPDTLIDAVLKQHDIVDVVSKYVHLSKQGKNLVGLCPFHSEKSPSFTVTPMKQIYHCFGCGAGGNSIKFIMEVEGYSFPEAVRQLAEDANIPFDWDDTPKEQTEQQKEKAELYKAYEWSAKWYHYLLRNSEHGKPAMEYLRLRGFTDKLIDLYQIGYAPPMWDTLVQFLVKRELDPVLMEKGGLFSERKSGTGHVDLFRDRIMFPIWDAKGRVVAFGGRLMGDGQPKYMNTPETMLFNKSKILYNFHHARASIRKTQTIVLFEGYVDAIKAWDAGVLNGVATMGTALTEAHAKLMKNNAEQVILCYDGDQAGQAAAHKSLAILESVGCKTSVAIIPNLMDPDDYISTYGPHQFNTEIIQAAVPSTKFKLLYLERNHMVQRDVINGEDEGNLRYIHSALKVIAELASPTEREHYLKSLSNDFHYSLDVLKQDLHAVRKDLQKVKPIGDNNDNSWNNVMNNRRVVEAAPSLLPAYHNAERNLLAIMMNFREVSDYVQQKLGDQFNVEVHAALAAYLYAYYSPGREPDVSRYIATLQNSKLESAASYISMIDSKQGINSQVIDDYIREIKKYPFQMTINQKKEEIMRAERLGDVLQATNIATEIIALEKQMKLM